MLKVREEEGVDIFISKIRNTIAGCREKWQKMPKVYSFEKVSPPKFVVQEMKDEYVRRSKESAASSSSSDQNKQPPAGRKPRTLNKPKVCGLYSILILM